MNTFILLEQNDHGIYFINSRTSKKIALKTFLWFELREVYVEIKPDEYERKLITVYGHNTGKVYGLAFEVIPWRSLPENLWVKVNTSTIKTLGQEWKDLLRTLNISVNDLKGVYILEDEFNTVPIPQVYTTGIIEVINFSPYSYNKLEVIGLFTPKGDWFVAPFGNNTQVYEVIEVRSNLHYITLVSRTQKIILRYYRNRRGELEGIVILSYNSQNLLVGDIVNMETIPQIGNKLYVTESQDIWRNK